MQCAATCKQTLFAVTPSDHGLSRNQERGAFGPTPGLGRATFLPRLPALTRSPTSHFVSDWLVSDGLLRTVLVFGRHQNGFFIPHHQVVLLLGWLQECLLPALCAGGPIPAAVGRFRLESATACHPQLAVPAACDPWM